jgi:hypothetical protein
MTKVLGSTGLAPLNSSGTPSRMRLTSLEIRGRLALIGFPCGGHSDLVPSYYFNTSSVSVRRPGRHFALPNVPATTSTGTTVECSPPASCSREKIRQCKPLGTDLSPHLHRVGLRFEGFRLTRDLLSLSKALTRYLVADRRKWILAKAFQ